VFENKRKIILPDVHVFYLLLLHRSPIHYFVLTSNRGDKFLNIYIYIHIYILYIYIISGSGISASHFMRARDFSCKSSDAEACQSEVPTNFVVMPYQGHKVLAL